MNNTLIRCAVHGRVNYAVRNIFIRKPDTFEWGRVVPAE